MNAEEFLKTALGGNMNFSSLKPLAISEIMEDYAIQKIDDTLKEMNKYANQRIVEVLEYVCDGDNEIEQSDRANLKLRELKQK